MEDATVQAIFDKTATVDADGEKEMGAINSDDEDDKAEEARQLISILDAIGDRMEQKTFPPVLPEEVQKADACTAAKETLQFILKMEATELQSYHDSKYIEFRKSVPADPNISEKVRRSRFAYDYFYPLTIEFYLEKTMRTHEFCHRVADGLFLPIIPIASIGDEASRSAAQGAVSQMRETHIVCFDAKLWSRWTEIEKFMSYAAAKKEVLFENFVRGEYFLLMKECLDEEKSKCLKTFQPLYNVEINDASSEVQAERRRLIADAVAEDSEEVEKQLVAGWQEEARKLPNTIKQYVDEDKIKEVYNEEKYFEILKRVVNVRQQSMCAAPLPQIWPKVDPRDGAGVDDHILHQRRTLLSRLASEDYARIEKEVEQKWSDTLTATEPHLRKFLQSQPPQEFWVDQYYDIAFRLFGDLEYNSAPSLGHGPDLLASGSAQGTRTSANENAPLTNESFGMNALLMRPTYIDKAPVLPDSPATYVSAEEMMQGTFNGVRWQYEGYLIDHDSELRTVTPNDTSRSPKKRSATGSSQDMVTLDMLLADRTGPISCTLWDEAAHRFLLLLGSVAPEEPVIVRLEYFRINSLIKNDWNGMILNNQKVIRSINAVGHQSATIVTLPTSASSPYLLSATFRSPPRSICIYDFFANRSRLQAPFKATIAGSVATVHDMDTTQSGQAKCSFELVDDSGCWISCCAIGRNATTPALKESMRVIVYNGSGRLGLKGSDASILILKDAVIVSVGRNEKIIPKRIYIDLAMPLESTRA